MNAPIFSRPRFLPGSKINGAQIDHAVISDGCIINRARITQSIIGLRTVVGEGTELVSRHRHGQRLLRVGRNRWSNTNAKANRASASARICRIENTIIDKNARIGNNVVISPAGKPEKLDHELYYIRNRIVIIPKNAHHPAQDGDLRGAYNDFCEGMIPVCYSVFAPF